MEGFKKEGYKYVCPEIGGIIIKKFTLKPLKSISSFQRLLLLLPKVSDLVT
jgi:hypothetical protein